MDVTPVTPEELAEIHARPDRYFVDDASGTLFRGTYTDEDDARFDPDTQQWLPDEFRTVEEHLLRGGYLTEITATEAAGLRTRDQGKALLARLATVDRADRSAQLACPDEGAPSA